MPVYTAMIENMTHSNATVANLLTNFTPTYTMHPFNKNKNKETRGMSKNIVMEGNEMCCIWQHK